MANERKMDKVTERIIYNGRSGGAGKGDKRRLGENQRKFRESAGKVQGCNIGKILVNGKWIKE